MKTYVLAYNFAFLTLTLEQTWKRR